MTSRVQSPDPAPGSSYIPLHTSSMCVYQAELRVSMTKTVLGHLQLDPRQSTRKRGRHQSLRLRKAAKFFHSCFSGGTWRKLFKAAELLCFFECACAWSLHASHYAASRRLQSSVRSGSNSERIDTIDTGHGVDSTISILIPPFDRSHKDELSRYPSVLHYIHVVPGFLSPAEALECQRLSYEYATKTNVWDEPDTSRHATYATCDFPVEDCRELQAYLEETLRSSSSGSITDRIHHHLQHRYTIQSRAHWSYLDLFCAHYQSQEKVDNADDSSAAVPSSSMDRLQPHRDGSLLSFTVLLSNPDTDFEGGGTTFDALRDVNAIGATSRVLHPGGSVRPLQAGDAVFHSGKLLHGADVVTKGSRTVIVGFLDIDICYQRPGALSEACRDWGRMDVASFHAKRQQQRTQVFRSEGSKRFLPPWPGSYIRHVIPAFPTIQRRANVDIQRRKRLEAEDRLLRSILLPEEQRQVDYTIL
jgi:hypothetical protein